jgi:hypothetical protein
VSDHALSVVVLSDLHAGKGNYYPDLRTGTGPASGSGKSFVTDHLIESIAATLTHTPASQRALVCAGDLASESHSTEFQRASDFLERVADALEVPQAHRFLVPGNHDIDWEMTKVAKKAKDPWYDGQRQTKYKAIVPVAARSFRTTAAGTPAAHACLGGRVQFFLLDSPWDDHVYAEPHHGRLGRDQLDSLKSLLSASGHGTLKIVLLHHHVTPQGRAGDEPDFSQLRDARDLIELAKSYQVALVINGHQHRFWFEEIPSHYRQVGVLCAGTATAAHRVTGDAVTAFHVVHFDDVDPRSAKGEIVSRVMITNRGWSKPHPVYHGVPPRRPFGFSGSRTDLDRMIDEAIEKCLATKILSLDCFLLSRPETKYLSPREFGQAVTDRLAESGRPGSMKIIFDDNDYEWQLQVVEVA